MAHGEAEPLRHFARAGRPLRRLLGQAGGDGFFPFEWQRRTGDLELEASLGDGGRNLALHLRDEVAREKRRLARQQFVERGAERVDVVRHLGLVPHHLLRAHVGRRARTAGLRGNPGHAVGDAAGNAKVGNLEVAVRIQHQVGRLQIAVDDPGLLVRVGQRLAHLLHPAAEFTGLKHPRRLVQPPVGQSITRDIFHRDRRGRGVLHKIVDPHDVRVREIERPPRLTLEVLHRRPVRLHHLGQEFERHLAVQLLVPRQPDHPHAAAPEDLLQGVAGEDLLPGGETLDRGAEIEVVHGCAGCAGLRAKSVPSHAQRRGSTMARSTRLWYFGQNHGTGTRATRKPTPELGRPPPSEPRKA